jgi:hypothetical protein
MGREIGLVGERHHPLVPRQGSTMGTKLRHAKERPKLRAKDKRVQDELRLCPVVPLRPIPFLPPPREHALKIELAGVGQESDLNESVGVVASGSLNTQSSFQQEGN